MFSSFMYTLSILLFAFLCVDVAVHSPLLIFLSEWIGHTHFVCEFIPMGGNYFIILIHALPIFIGSVQVIIHKIEVS